LSDKDFKVKNKLIVNGLNNASGVILSTNNTLDSHNLLPTQYGGTGTTQSPSSGQILYSASGTTYTPTTLSTLVQGAKYQADAPSSPAVGDIWIESDVDVDVFDSNLIRRQAFTATAGQTVFTTDIAFVSGYEQVYFNGMLLLKNSDYTTSSTNTITLTSAAAVNDIVEVITVTNLNSVNTYTQAEINAALSYAVSGLATSTSVTSAISTHSSASDPHGDRSFATSAVSTHNTAANGHFGRGTTASRPASPTIGDLYFDTTLGALIAYKSGGWQKVSQDPAPQIATISPTTAATTGTTVTVTGLNFKTGLAIQFIGTNGTAYNSPISTFVNVTTATATTPALPVAYEPYDIKVINDDNQFAVLDNCLDSGGTPTWNTASGTLTTINEQTSLNTSVSATDPDGTSIVYSSSNLPAWVSLNSSTGALTGTAPDVASNTTYSFDVTASDGVNSSSRSFNIIVNVVVTFQVDYLVVAGGGGGGSRVGGGGGAGGLRTSYSASGGGSAAESKLTFVPGTTYTISVGSGGGTKFNSGGIGQTGNNGQNSFISGSGITTITAIGGGGGGAYATIPAANGGSGGGEGGYTSGGIGTGTSGQGYNGGGGGSGPTTTSSSGGGGGAGSVGSSASYDTAGNGGAGIQSSITGTATYYAGGGGGCTTNGSLGTGGSGGGGNGDTNNSNTPTSGAANTGGGGGGARLDNATSGAGGSGVVILRTVGSAVSTTGSVTTTTSGGFNIYKFTSTGSITF